MSLTALMTKITVIRMVSSSESAICVVVFRGSIHQLFLIFLPTTIVNPILWEQQENVLICSTCSLFSDGTVVHT